MRLDYTTTYRSPLGDLLLAADDAGLTGVWFYGQKYFPPGVGAPALVSAAETSPVFQNTVFRDAVRWLDTYFAGKNPGFTPTLHLTGTPFQMDVWELLLAIPYGATTTYGGLAKQLAAKRGLAHLSAQAVGGAVGHNPISIIVPCHRVVGVSGSLTGYAGGVERKAALLALEDAVR